MKSYLLSSVALFDVKFADVIVTIPLLYIAPPAAEVLFLKAMPLFIVNDWSTRLFCKYAL